MKQSPLYKPTMHARLRSFPGWKGVWEQKEEINRTRVIERDTSLLLATSFPSSTARAAGQQLWLQHLWRMQDRSSQRRCLKRGKPLPSCENGGLTLLGQRGISAQLCSTSQEEEGPQRTFQQPGPQRERHAGSAGQRAVGSPQSWAGLRAVPEDKEVTILKDPSWRSSDQGALLCVTLALPPSLSKPQPNPSSSHVQSKPCLESADQTTSPSQPR